MVTGKSRWVGVLFVACFALVPLSAVADPLAYEGFSAAGNGADLQGYQGGTATGLSGVWSVTGPGATQIDTINRAAGPLFFPSNVAFLPSQSGSDYQWAERASSQGNWAIGNATRPLNTAINFGADGEYYVSYLARIHADDSNMMVGLSDGTDLLTTGMNYYAGRSRFAFSYGPTPPGTNTAGSADSGLGVRNNHVYFVVARLQTSAAGSDTISYKAYDVSGALVHGDPSQLSGVGAGANQWTMQQTVTAGNSFNQLYAQFDGPGYPNFDEIRVGAAWADVTSVSGPLPTQSAGRKLGFNFVGGGPSSGTLVSSDNAGAPGIDQIRWNNLATDWQGNVGAVPVSVVDNLGNIVGIDNNSALGLRVEYDSNTVWGTGIAATTANQRLMRGYLDDAGVGSSQPYVNLTNLPFERYNVAVYVDGDQTNGVDGQYWLETLGGVQLTDKVFARDVGHFSGTFTQVPATSTDQGAAVTGNYIVFEGLTNRDIRVRASQVSGTRAPINGIQLIDDSPAVALAPNKIVGLNIIGTGGASPGALAAGETAGASGYAQQNWNNLATDWQGNAGAVPNPLVDSAGATVGTNNDPNLGMAVQYDANGVWGNGISDSTPDHRLMRGYLDSNSGDTSQPYVVVQNVPYNRYDVIVYMDGDVTNGELGQYWVETTAGSPVTNKVYVRDVYSFNGRYARVPVSSTAQGAAPEGNYVVFENLDLLDFRVRGSQPDGAIRAPINAVQVLSRDGPVAMAPNRIVGLNLVGTGGPSPGTLAASDVAGASGYAQANWNNLATDWQGNSGAVPNPLLDSAGATVGTGNDPNLGMAVQYDASNTWGTGIGAGTPDQRLMRGYLDSNNWQAGQPYVTLQNVPFNAYDVVLYFDGDVTNGELGQYWVETTSGAPLTPKVYARDMYNFNGRFTQVPVTSTTQGSAPVGNYIVFEGLTNLDVRIRGGEVAGTRAPINAVQVLSKDGPKVEAPDRALGFNFVGGGPGSGTLAAGELAGASGFAQQNWNNLATDWQGNGGAVPATVYDNRGSVAGTDNLAANGVRVEYDAANVWGTGIPGGTPDQRLMRGYLDSNSGDLSQPYVNVLNVPYYRYDVVLYVDGDVTNGPLGQYWLETLAGDDLTPMVYAYDMYNFGGRFTEVPETSTVQGSAPIGNYIVFEDIFADSFRIRGSQVPGTRSPINAFQIVEVVPEPASVVLALVGLAALLGVLWRKRRGSVGAGRT